MKFTEIFFTPNFTVVFLTLHNRLEKKVLKFTDRGRKVKIKGYFTKFVPHRGGLINELARRSWCDKQKLLSGRSFKKVK